LISITRKDIFGSNINRIYLAGDGIRDIKTRADIITGVDITITTWISGRRKHNIRLNKLTELIIK
jgi:hypothetical protein